MNYIKIYNDLISRSKIRTLSGYVERHHIVPRCMGGNNSSKNIAILTPEEHYVAHQLLVRIYPNEPKLVFALVKMSGNNQYRTNKLYGWIRKKFSEEMSALQKGRPKSREHKRKIGNANRGRKQTQEHISKRMQSIKNARHEKIIMTIPELDEYWGNFWRNFYNRNDAPIITALIYSIT